MVDRMEFDNNNLNYIMKEHVFLSEKVLRMEDQKLITDKNEYEFQYIIFADGVNGFSKRMISNRKSGFCVECNVEEMTDKTIFDFDAVKGGYGWVFPKKNHTTIGIGAYRKKKTDYVNILRLFAQKYHFEIQPSGIRGYYVPVFSKKIYKKSVIDNRMILVGDAASLVDAISGKGIYYALLSGMKAVESIILSLQNKENLRKTYLRETREIYHSLKKRKFWRKILYSHCGILFVKFGLSNSHFINRLDKAFG